MPMRRVNRQFLLFKIKLILTPPWRFDAAPIVLSKYLYLSHKISCDYIYEFSEAIGDDVCRIPEIVKVIIQIIVGAMNLKIINQYLNYF